jgi:hypothetical protein
MLGCQVLFSPRLILLRSLELALGFGVSGTVNALFIPTGSVVAISSTPPLRFFQLRLRNPYPRALLAAVLAIVSAL